MQRDRAAVDSFIVTTPARQILPGQTYFISCRAVNRTFRFVPNDKVTQLIAYVFAKTVEKYGCDVHEVVYMSNHFHIVVTFNDDSLSDFMRDLNSLTTRSLNALRGRSGACIETHFNAVLVTDREKCLEHCAYTLANPCSANLVTRADKWRGFTSARMNYGQKVSFQRPNFGLWGKKRAKAERKQAAKRRSKGRAPGRARHAGRSTSPKVVSFELVRPPGFDELRDEQLRDEVVRRVVREEAADEADRAAKGKRVLGMRRTAKQHWNDYPKDTEDMFGPVPKASGMNKWARIEQLQRCAIFQAAYRTARAAFIAGDRDVEFPYGTWQMRRRYNVNCAGASP